MKKQLLAILACLLPAAASHAFNVSPMVADFDPNSRRASQVYVINNTSDEEKPVEVLVARPELGENNQETLSIGDGEDNFLILPQQLVIPPNTKRSVKVFYVGDPIEEEETYRIIFKQLPVSVPTDDSSLADNESAFEMKVVLEYHTRAWITPSGLNEKLSITAFEKVEIENPRADPSSPEFKKPMLKMTVANTGDKHGYLRFPTLSIITKDNKAHIVRGAEELGGFAGQVVLKQRTRDLLIPWRDEFPDVTEIKELRVKTK